VSAFRICFVRSALVALAVRVKLAAHVLLAPQDLHDRRQQESRFSAAADWMLHSIKDLVGCNTALAG
jgi:hypothetical protein